jgi:hypothetical protein
LNQFEVDDSNTFLTTDAGGPIQDSESLKAGLRGPTLLEDFIFRQKITHFDHERVSWLLMHRLFHKTYLIQSICRSQNVLFMLVVLVSRPPYIYGLF